MMVAVYGGKQLLEARDCRVLRLPGGREGAVWRGLAYPLLLPEARIDIDGEAFALGECEDRTLPPYTSPFAIIEGEDEAYVLVTGSATSCESAATSLRAAGFDVMRTGRYLGDPVAGIDADWFVRILKPTAADEPLSTVLERLLGKPYVADMDAGESTSEVRLRLIAAELMSAKVQAASLRSEIARLKLASNRSDETKGEVEALRAALDEERKLRVEAEAAATIGPTASPPVRVAAPASPKLKVEIEAVISALLPRVHLIRDSLMVVAAEFASRRTIYRSLGELQDTKERLPLNWKKVQGVDGWWERHVSNGQDDSGRAYARLDNTERRWEVLVSHKGEQSRDISWLKRQ